MAYEISKQELLGLLVALAYLAIFSALYIQVGRRKKDGPTKGGRKAKLLPKRN